MKHAVWPAAAAALLAGACMQRKEVKTPMADIRKAIEASEPQLRFRYGQAEWELVLIPAGTFLMGSPHGEAGRAADEALAKQVRITKPFYMGRHETTQAQYEAVMHRNPSVIKGETMPVYQVRYSDALEFCRRLSRLLGVKVTLPTEAQWEYASRAGTTTPYYTGSSEADLERAGWYRGNSGGRVHAVGQKQPNAWGLYDMLGNVYEPCSDYILDFRELGELDPTGESYSDHGAARGGSWMESATRCRAAWRIQSDDMFAGMGIRIAIEPMTIREPRTH